eukprot:gene9785-13163_t
MNQNISLLSTNNVQNEVSDKITLRIRATEGKEIEVEAYLHESVSYLRDRVEAKLLGNEHKNHYVRLIFCGKMLDPPSSLLSSYKMTNGSFVHAVISSKPTGISQSTNSTNNNPINQLRVSSPLIPPTDRRGFNILQFPPSAEDDTNPISHSRLTIGLTPEEIITLRSYFSEDVTRYMSTTVSPQSEEESDENYRYRGETEWMAAQINDPNSEFMLNLPLHSSSNQEGSSFLTFLSNIQRNNQYNNNNNNEYSDDSGELGTSRDFLYGFMLGFMLGFMMIFCVWDRNVNHRQKVGIMCGIICQMFINSSIRTNQIKNNNNNNNKLTPLNNNNNNGATDQTSST